MKLIYHLVTSPLIVSRMSEQRGIAIEIIELNPPTLFH